MRSKLAHLGIAVTAALIPCHIESAFVFYHREKGESAGHRFTELKRAWQKLLKEASIDNLRFHDLRHTCASWLVMKGVPLQTVQQILGHKSFVTTLATRTWRRSFEMRRPSGFARLPMDTFWTLEPPPWGVSPSAPPQMTGRQGIVVRAVGIEPTTHGLKTPGGCVWSEL